MNDDELDRLVATTAPIDDRRLDAVPLAEPLDRLREDIMASHHPIPRSVPRRLAAVAAVAALFVGLVAFVVAGGGADERRAWAAELVEFAESSPQLLLGQPGWEVIRADQYGDGEGEMTFGNEGREADLHWRAGSFDDWAASRAAGASSVTSVRVLGVTAQLSKYEGTNEFTALWPEQGRTIEFRMSADDQAAFVATLTSLTRVDTDAWLSAMPDRVIRSAQRAVVVGEMLADVALPPEFDLTVLTSSTELKDRYQLGAEVTGAVGCAWVERWIQAKADGDSESIEMAVEAMADSHGWAILDEMSSDGAWPQVFWTVADGMVNGGVVDAGLRVEDFYATAIGCVDEAPTD